MSKIELTDFKIISLVFFDRLLVIIILNCYYKKNLVSNYRFLNQVIYFVINIENLEDIIDR